MKYFIHVNIASNLVVMFHMTTVYCSLSRLSFTLQVYALSALCSPEVVKYVNVQIYVHRIKFARNVCITICIVIIG